MNLAILIIEMRSDMKLLILILLMGTICNASVENGENGADWYLTPYQPGHPECIKISNVLMKCPSGGLVASINPVEQIEMDVEAWSLLEDCDRISDNVSLCPN
jgi:hypothetical protein